MGDNALAQAETHILNDCLQHHVALQGGEIDDNPALLRQTLKQIKLCQMEEFAEHAEKSCLMADAAGLLHFDGGSYSSSISDLGAISEAAFDAFRTVLPKSHSSKVKCIPMQLLLLLLMFKLP